MVVVLSYVVSAQTFQNTSLETANAEQFSHLIEMDDYYLITGMQVDDTMATGNYQKRNFYLKVPKIGVDTQFIPLQSWGCDIDAWGTVYKEPYFYTFYSKNTSNDSNTLYIECRDTSFNLVASKNYTEIKERYFALWANFLVEDTIVNILSHYRKPVGLTFYSSLIQVSLPSLSLIKKVDIDGVCLAKDMLRRDNEYLVLGTASGPSSPVDGFVIRYDSLLNKIDSTNLHYYGRGNINIIEYQDSNFLISCRQTDYLDPLNAPYPEYTFQLYDQDLNFLSYQSYDVNNYVVTRPSYNRNLVKNNRNEVFGFAYLENTSTTYDTLGVLVIKLDSNLNLLWKKHITGNSNYKASNILPTDDGGAVMIIRKDPRNMYTNMDAYFIKIGPNGEITSLINLSNEHELTVSIYPNPTSQYVNLELPNSIDFITHVEILDMNGKTLSSRNVQSTRAQIDVANLSKGVYFVLAYTQSGMIIKEKFVKE
jgi:hypothetical protein